MLVAAVVGATLAVGCGRHDEPPDDAAMVWARADGKNAEDAARDYFDPRFYPTAFGAEKPIGVHDYFKQMDSIAVLPGAVDSGGGVNPLLAPVHQLLDRQLAGDASAGAGSGPGQGSHHFRIVQPLTTENEVLGRNTWMIWCGGNERFWDWLANNSLGFADLLKLVDSRNRATRFAEAGLINEPGMVQMGAPSQDEFGLWLDQPQSEELRAWRSAYARSSFEQLRKGTHPAQRSPQQGGSAYGAAGGQKEGGYGSTGSTAAGSTSAEEPLQGYSSGVPAELADQIPPPAIYGLSSGVVGLRLFPNPDFDAEAQKRWDAKRYYEDESYYSRRDLIRPYRVGMSCAFCHASFHPLVPPREVSEPGWENISGSIGAQYLRIRSVFGNLLTPDNLIYHILDSQPPGTIDTSLVASDNINNPNAMNSVFNVPDRVLVSFMNPLEQLSSASAGQPSVWQHPEKDPPPGADSPPQAYRDLFAALGLSADLENSNAATRRVPRILFDGADSIGAWGALARVYLNIGTYSEQWLRLHNPLIGFLPQQPFTIADCERHSVYWHATQRRVGPLRDYFLKVTPPMPLLATPPTTDEAARFAKAQTGASPGASSGSSSGSIDLDGLIRERARTLVDASKLAHGRRVFAENCIVCHSSIQPETPAGLMFLPAPAGEEAKRFGQRFARVAQERSEFRAGLPPGELWDHDPGRWLRDDPTRSDDYVDWARAVVELPGFWQRNYLATDYRIPVNVVHTNSARAMATNALHGSMWDNFSSESYQHLPSVGEIPFYSPYAYRDPDDLVTQPPGAATYTPQHAARGDAPPGGGGPGFYRVPTLRGIWATAPLLHNNSVGLFNNDPSVKGRLESFDDSIRKLLWPERRRQSSSYNGATPERLERDHGLIWRTPQESTLVIAGSEAPRFLAKVPFIQPLTRWFRWIEAIPPGLRWVPSGILLVAAFVVLGVARRFPVRLAGYATAVVALAVGGLIYTVAGDLAAARIGPIPAGTPVNLLANMNPDAPPLALKRAINETLAGLSEIDSRHLDAEAAQKVLHEKVAPALLSVSKCPDFVMDKGHAFEWFEGMTDEDKEALIELLKTF